jgi:hypothetical protein
MKKIIYYIGLFLAVSAGSSCSNKYDDAAAPSETVKGTVTDATTGAGIETDQSESGTRIRMEELKYTNPIPSFLYSRQDGSFINTKVFAGKYRMTAEGPFVPLLQTDGTGTVTVDKRQTIDVKGTTTVDFKVEPFLNVEWVGEPAYNSADKTFTVQVKITRGTANPAFQQNVSDAFLYVSYVPFVSNSNRIEKFSSQLNNPALNSTVTIKSKGQLDGNRDFYLRVGARIAYGLNYYNYTVVKKITVP